MGLLTEMMERWIEVKVEAYFGGSGGRSGDDKPPCSFCAGNHGVWACRKFQGLAVEATWNDTKEKHLCFRYLGSDHRDKLVQDRRRVVSLAVRGITILSYTIHDTSLEKQSEEHSSMVPGEGGCN